MKTIDVKRLADEQGQKDIDVIDVRMPTEFREIHAECARNVTGMGCCEDVRSSEFLFDN